MHTPASGKIARPENLLFRSRIEICRILQVLARERCAVSAQINHHTFASHLLSVNSETDHVMIAYCPHKTINTLALASSSVAFTATDHQDLHYSFEASSPEEVQFEEQPALQFTLPKTLILHNRREHQRDEIPIDISLRCVADTSGIIPFESHITDVSHDGLGCLIYDTDIVLAKGAVLKDCRIITPGGDAVVADLELRYVTTTTLADGTLANRGGFRFVQRPEQMAKLVNLFIQDLDKK